MKALCGSIMAALLGQASPALAAPIAYVVRVFGGGILALDAASNAVTQAAPGSFGGELAVHPAGTRVYATTFSGLAVLDTTTSAINVVPFGGSGSINDVAVNPAGTRIYVAQPVGGVPLWVLDASTNAVIDSVPLGIRGARVAASNSAVYVVGSEDSGDEALEVVDVDCNVVSYRVELPTDLAVDVAVNPAGTRVYVTAFGAGLAGSVFVVDTAIRSSIATVPVGVAPVSLTVNPAGTRVYVVNASPGASSGSLSVIDAATNTVITTVPVGRGPEGVAVHPAGTHVYVTNQVDSTVSVIDASTNTVTATLPLGSLPDGIAFAYGVVPAPPPVEPAEDVRVTGMELTQGIQDLANTVPLIAGRKTFVRVYAESDAPVPGVTANLSGVATRCFLGNCTTQFLGSLVPVNEGGPRITVRENPKRSVLDDSFLFELPTAWTTSGGLQLHAALTDSAEPAPPPACLNDVLAEPIHEFQYARFMKIQFVRLAYLLADEAAWATERERQEVESLIGRTFPISSLAAAPDFQLIDYELASRVDQSAEECQEMPEERRSTCAMEYITSTLSAREALTGFLGLLAQRVQGTNDYSGFFGTADGAYALIPQHPAGKFTRGACCKNRIGAGASNVFDTAAHEMAHLFGRQHPVNGFTVCGHDPVDDQYPHALAFIGGTDALLGFDGGDTSLGIPVSLRGASNYYDLMSYCQPRWISDYTYNALSLCLREVGGSSSSIIPGCGEARGAADAGGSGPMSGDWLLAYGSIAPDTGSARFLATQRVDRVVSIPPREPGDHSVRLVDEAGAVLADYPFAPVASAEGPGDGGVPSFSFGHVVPFVAGAREIQIVDSAAGVVVGTKAVSPNAPLIGAVTLSGDPDPVTGALEVAWTASDADGDALTFDLFLTRDGGASFLEPLQLNRSETSVQLDTSGLHGGVAQVRVVASDGLLTARADSPEFVLPDKPPRPQILSPADGAVAYEGQLVALEGKAYDPKDGQVIDTGLAWSTAAGPLGTGSQLPLTHLPVGTHEITLTATNSRGLEASTDISVTVNAVVDLPGPMLTAGPLEIGWQVAVGETQPQTAELNVGNAGGGDLEFTAQSSAPWLTVSPGTALAPTTLTLTADPSGLGAGVTREAHVTLTALGLPGQAITIPVSLAAGNTFSVPVQECANGSDDDGDGASDLADPGCDDASDVTERSLTLPCDDGLDNDGDGGVDFRPGGDVGCATLDGTSEAPECQDGVDNDAERGIDFDGGASLDLDGDGFVDARFDPATPAVGARDPQCGAAFVKSERSGGFPCGIGPELAALVPLLLAARAARKRRGRSRTTP